MIKKLIKVHKKIRKTLNRKQENVVDDFYLNLFFRKFFIFIKIIWLKNLKAAINSENWLHKAKNWKISNTCLWFLKRVGYKLI